MGKLRNNQTGSAVLIVIVVMVAALVGVMGWKVYKNHHKTTTVVAPTTKVIKTKTSTTPVTPVDPTTGWATYTSTLGGFSFKYPSTGWDLDGFQGETDVSGSTINGSEDQIRLVTNTTSPNVYAIIVRVDKDPGKVASESDYLYPDGTLSTLTNGLQIWETSASYAKSSQCFDWGYADGAPIDLNLVSNGNFDMQLHNGKYVSFNATWCYGQKTTTTLTYQQQISSPEWTIAKEVLASLKQL